MNPFIGWLGSSLVTIIALVLMWYAFKIIINMIFLQKGDFWRSLFQLVVIVLIIGKGLIPAGEYLWKNFITQIPKTQMFYDIARVFTQPSNLGLTGEGVEVWPEPSAATAVPPAQVYVQPTSQPAAQNFPKPPAVKFLLSAEFPDGKERDICLLDWLKSTDLTWWEPKLVDPCNEHDEPSGNPITVPWSMLTITSGTPPTIVAQPAMIVPPTSVPPVEEQPVLQPSGLTQEEWNGACSDFWAAWADQNDLRYLRDATIGTDALPAGTNWTLTGPGELSSFWHTAGSEQWYLSSEQLEITNYPINGVVGRGFPFANDNGQVALTGSGSQCESLGFPIP